jgi:hypothetical protein
VPADVTLTLEFYPGSDPARKETFTTSGKADRLGLFVGPERYVFKEEGEYFSRVEARYTARDGTLWMGSLWGAMVVASKDSPLVAHGRRGYMRNGTALTGKARFALGREGGAESGETHFLYYPYYGGDVMYIASSMDHRNYIYPIFSMAFTDGFIPYGGGYGVHPLYPLFPTTPSRWSPFCFPEAVDRIGYFYADGWRPGVCGRHIIGTNQLMNSYWSTSPSFLGGQMHVSENGDLPGDYYRYTGGVVYRDLKTKKSRYGIYAAMGVVTRKGEKNNRIVEACAEPLFTLDERTHYLFLGGGILPVPGMILLEGVAAPAGGAANPPVPADLETVVFAPSGKKWTHRLKANRIGVFPRSRETATRLIEPGVWRARQKLSYKGKTGDVLGSDDGEYVFFVAPKDPKKHFELEVELPPFSRVEPGRAVKISGVLPEDVADGTLHYSTITPGFILEEGSLAVAFGGYTYLFDPWQTGKRLPFYDTVDHLTGRPALSDTVIINLFFEGTRKNGEKVYGSKVLVLRGDLVINAHVE